MSKKFKNNLSIVTFLLSFSLNFNSHAAVTKGNYLQVNVVGMKSTQRIPLSKEVAEATGENLEISDTLSSSGIGYGLSYKYAFSMKEYLVEPLDRIFIAPGLFYDNVQTEDSDKFFHNNVSLNRRYGASLDVGVDFDFGISGYFTNGLSALDYQVDWVNYEDGLILALVDPSYETRKTTVSGTSWAYFYGIGVAYTPVDWLSLALEYSMQSNTLDAVVPGGYETTGIIYDRVISNSKILKFGVAYHF